MIGLVIGGWTEQVQIVLESNTNISPSRRKMQTHAFLDDYERASMIKSMNDDIEVS